MPTSIGYEYPSNSYSTYSSISGAESLNTGAIVGIISSFYAIFLLVIFIAIVSSWKIFTKAGKPGWACLIPIYNFVIMLRIACMPEWLVILLFVPLVNAFIGLVVQVKMVKAFGKSTGFIIGYLLLPLIFLPILAFDNSQYIGDGTNPTNPPQPNTPPQTNTNQNPNQPQTVTPPVTVLPPVPPSNPPQPPTTNI